MPAPRRTTKLEVLRGLVDRVVFHNEDNGYCILKIVPEGKQDVVSLIGKAPRVVAGEVFEARGVWEPNRDFGPQFKADELKLRRPNSLGGIERYLGSGLIEGIGPKYAKRIVEKFGPRSSTSSRTSLRSSKTSRAWAKNAASRFASRG